uniref:Reverse transcriptase domain-containing protein n=3 Tax=Panagrellus redivivus TaxID=6233 RepID=A0A7E4VLC6_PANRE
MLMRSKTATTLEKAIAEVEDELRVRQACEKLDKITLNSVEDEEQATSMATLIEHAINRIQAQQQRQPTVTTNGDQKTTVKQRQPNQWQRGNNRFNPPAGNQPNRWQPNDNNRWQPNRNQPRQWQPNRNQNNRRRFDGGNQWQQDGTPNNWRKRDEEDTNRWQPRKDQRQGNDNDNRDTNARNRRQATSANFTPMLNLAAYTLTLTIVLSLVPSAAAAPIAPKALPFFPVTFNLAAFFSVIIATLLKIMAAIPNVTAAHLRSVIILLAIMASIPTVAAVHYQWCTSEAPVTYVAPPTKTPCEPPKGGIVAQYQATLFVRKRSPTTVPALRCAQNAIQVCRSSNAFLNTREWQRQLQPPEFSEKRCQRMATLHPANFHTEKAPSVSTPFWGESCNASVNMVLTWGEIGVVTLTHLISNLAPMHGCRYEAGACHDDDGSVIIWNATEKTPDCSYVKAGQYDVLVSNTDGESKIIVPQIQAVFYTAKSNLTQRDRQCLPQGTMKLKGDAAIALRRPVRPKRDLLPLGSNRGIRIVHREC